MNDADRHDQIEALTVLRGLLNDENAEASDIRDAAIRAVNRFDASIAAHGGCGPTAGGDRRTPRRGPKRTASGRSASSATPSTAAGCAAESGTQSR